jgi:hypothetical protein
MAVSHNSAINQTSIADPSSKTRQRDFLYIIGKSCEAYPSLAPNHEIKSQIPDGYCGGTDEVAELYPAVLFMSAFETHSVNWASRYKV